MNFVPRPYQVLLESDIRNAMRQHRRVVAVSPTGSGKTQIFCSVSEKVRRRGRSVMLIAHRIEIVEQIGKALFRFGVPHGWIAPGHVFQKQPIMVAMVQSLARRLDQIDPPDLLVVDEAHHATAGLYRKVMEAWPKIFVLGVTASPARTDGKGLQDVFDYMVFGPKMRELIDQGYLASFKCFAPPVAADLSGISVRAGDFAADQVSAAMDKRAVTGDAVCHYAKHLNGAPAIAFCSSVEHAEHVAAQFNEAGWKAASVDGSMKLKGPGGREDRIKSIGDGRLNVLTSCDVISEGTDIPSVAGAILLRPTMSLIVYLQQVGRVLRPKPDLSAAIILDHVGNVLRFGLPDAERPWSLEGWTKRSAPPAPSVRQCGECFMAFAPSPKCPGCGYVFPIKSRAPDRKQIDGELQEIIVTEPPKPKRDDIKAALRGAHSLAEFQAVARDFGYKSGWAFQMHAIYSKNRGKAA